MKSILHTVFALNYCLLSACAAAPQVPDRNSDNNFDLTIAKFSDLPSVGTTTNGQKILLGGFSGLNFLGMTEDGKRMRFVTHTDRGPNCEPTKLNGKKVRPFPLSNFQPQIVHFEYDPNAKLVRITKQIPLQKENGTALTGLPNLKDEGETPVDLTGNPVSFDKAGGDLEAIASLPDGSYWIGDEYQPSLFRFNSAGKLQNRIVPQKSKVSGLKEIPAVYGKRKDNRGFEALAYDGKKLYAFLQSPLKTGAKKTKNLRILEFDPTSLKTTAQYLYILENGPSDKIGDAISIGRGEFLVLEAGQKTKKKSATKRIYKISLAGATNVNATPALETLSSQALTAQNITPAGKKLFLDLSGPEFPKLDKLEGLALVDATQVALVNDNDFGLDGECDLKSGMISESKNPENSLFMLVKTKKP